jgi:hypothetical protein
LSDSGSEHTSHACAMHTSPPPRHHDTVAVADDAFAPETEIPLAFSAFKPFKEPLPPSRSPAPPPILTPDDAIQLFTLTSPQSNTPTLICTPVHRRRNTTILSPKSINIHPTPSSPSYRTSCLTQPRIRPLSRTSSFATLAPLPSSRSAHRTPIDHERTLKRSADSMTRLLISDDTENTNSSDSDAPPNPASHSKRRRDAKSCQRRASRRHRLPRSPSYLKAQPRELVPSSPCPSFGHSLMLKPSNLSLRSPLARSLPRRGRVDSQSSSSSTESSCTTDRFPKKNEWNRCSLSGGPDSEDEEPPGKFAGSIASSTHYRSNTPIPDVDDSDLVTPQMHPTPASNWPSHPESPSREDVDRFIIQALTTSATGGCQDKRMPHTPVKRQPFLTQSARRPWMSVGRLNTETIQNPDGGLFGKARKSMPNALPSFTTFATPFRRHPTVISRNNITYPEMSPTDSRSVQTPTTPAFQPQLLQRFDSGSSFGSDGSFYGTPTRPKGHRMSLIATQHPSPHSIFVTTTAYYQRSEKAPSAHIADSPSPSPTKSGRLEKEFEVLDEIGTGQFGDVIKVRSKAGCAAPKSPGTEYALKRTQRFEGQKSRRVLLFFFCPFDALIMEDFHRARLMEESSILKKLCSEVAHRNVAKYIDSWEEDNMLFILTELYPLGNLAHFLSEYGTRFERLEEVRCWKILADLSSVC